MKSTETICPNVNVEYVAVKIMWPSKIMYLYVAYIPPVSSASIYYSHYDIINFFISRCNLNDIVWVLGDFNLPNIKWYKDFEDNDLLFPINISTEEEQSFIDSMQSLNLQQICKVSNLNGSFLDLIFLNEPFFGLVSKSLLAFTPEQQHHCGLELNIDCNELFCKFGKNNSKPVTYNFRKADIPALTKFFEEIDWSSRLINDGNGDVNIMVDKFYAVLFEAFDKYVPMTRNTISYNPPWFNKSLVNYRNKKNKAHKLMKSDPNNQCFLLQYKNLRGEFDRPQRGAYRDYVATLEDNLISDTKQLWKYVDAKRKCTGYPATMSLNNNLATNNEDICNLFANHFQSVYEVHDNGNIDGNCFIDHSNSNGIMVGVPRISEQDVFNGILKMNYGQGADNIPSSILKSLAHVLLHPLTLIFNTSLCSGVFPTSWKMSIVIPIYKSGKRCHIENYRGISILSSIPKLFEMIVCDYLYFHLKSSIVPQQHGFVKQRSTTTNLLTLTCMIIDAFETKSQLDIIFTDFSKAFDSTNFEILLCKLNNTGLNTMFRSGLNPIFVVVNKKLLL